MMRVKINNFNFNYRTKIEEAILFMIPSLAKNVGDMLLSSADFICEDMKNENHTLANQTCFLQFDYRIRLTFRSPLQQKWSSSPI